MTRLRSVLSPPMLVALLALVVALGGTSYAAAKLPRNSVGSLQVKNGSLTSADVKDRSLRAADLAPGVLKPGPRGPAGADGGTGPQGSAAFAVLTGQAPLPAANTTTSLDGRLQAASGISVATLAPDVATSIRSFSARIDGPAPAGTGRSFQVRINEEPSLLCSIEAGESTCASTAAVAVPAGATIRLVVLSLAGGGTQVTTVARWGMTIGTS